MTEHKPDAVVKAGGIAGLEAKTDAEATGELSAVSYRHPALAGRTIVRLVESSLDTAIDAEMAALGFEPKTARVAVGRTRKRALGFPAWALVHHPKKAQFALDVMRDFRKAATRTRTKPGHARDAFVEIGKKLERSVPAFMPSYWEEVGRVFLGEDALSFAAQSFEKARSAERAFKLPVDEDLRASAYLEFATAGAVPAKSLASYAGDLSSAFGALEAAQRFVKLNVQRIKAGLPPWTGMAKEITKLAAAAKQPKIEGELLHEVLGSAALKKAAPDFWAAYRPLLLQLATQSPDIRAKLTALWPTPRGFSKFLPTWLSLLSEIGSIDQIANGPAADAAQFLSALTRYVTHDDQDGGVPAEYFQFFARIAPVLAKAGEPVDLRSDGWNDDGTYSLDVLETALEHGLTLTPPKPDADLDLWGGFHKDPVLLAAHPEFSKLLDTAVQNVFGRDEFEARAKGKKGLVEARRRFLSSVVEKLHAGALPRLADVLETLTDRTKAATFVEFPEAAAALAKVDVGRALARTLRGGLFDELAWPAYEAALAAFGPKAEIEAYGTHQHPILRAGRKVVVFDGPDKLKDYDLPPAVSDLHDLLFLDGDLFIEYDDKDDNRRGLWASKAKAPFELQSRYRSRSLISAVAVAGGGVCLGKGTVVHAGDALKQVETEDFLSDGTTLWTQRERDDDGRVKLLELDPKTGKNGRASWPEFVRAASERADDYKISNVRLVPMPKAKTSRVGWKDGLDGHYTRIANSPSEGVRGFELVRIDGARWTAQGVDRVIDWPGDGSLRGLDISSAWSRDDDDDIKIHTESDDMATATFGDDGWKTAGFRLLPRGQWLPYLIARDESASTLLRGVADDVAAALVIAAREDDEDDDDVIDAALAGVKKHLPTLKNEVLRRAVAKVAKVAAKLANVLEKLQDGEATGDGPEDDSVKAALPQLPTAGWNDGYCASDMKLVGAAFRDKKIGKLTDSCIAWERSLGGFAKLACHAASRTTDEAKRDTIQRLLAAFVDSGLMGLTVTRAVLEVKTGSALLVRPKDRETWIATVGDACWFVRMEDFDEDEPKQTLQVLVPGAKLVVPKDATVSEQSTVDVPDEREFVTTFWRELEARGAVPHDPTAPAWVASNSTLSAAEATLLLAGLPNFDDYAHDFLGKELRATLGLKTTEANAAKEKLSELPDEQRSALLEGMTQVDTPAAYWATAAHDGSVARALAATARRLFGKSVLVREELVTQLKKMHDAPLGERKALTLLLTAGEDDNQWLQLPAKRPAVLSVEGDADAFGNQVIETTAFLLPYLAALLPVGDEYRAALPVLYDRVRSYLDRPNFLIELGSYYEDADAKLLKMLDKIGGKPIQVTIGEKTLQGRDNGILHALHKPGHAIELAVRTDKLRDHAADLEPYFDIEDLYGSDTVKRALYLVSKECEALVDRIRKTPVPAGSYELNPLLSTKKTIAAVVAELGLDDNAAALYLQTLVLPSPQKRLLLTVNGWTPAVYDKASQVLVKKKLLIEGKRERAGRDVFLPGGWEKRSEGIPMESYKLSAFAKSPFDTPMLLSPPHELYARAWARWMSGDKPGFENVDRSTKRTKSE